MSGQCRRLQRTTTCRFRPGVHLSSVSGGFATSFWWLVFIISISLPTWQWFHESSFFTMIGYWDELIFWLKFRTKFLEFRRWRLDKFQLYSMCWCKRAFYSRILSLFIKSNKEFVAIFTSPHPKNKTKQNKTKQNKTNKQTKRVQSVNFNPVTKQPKFPSHVINTRVHSSYISQMHANRG